MPALSTSEAVGDAAKAAVDLLALPSVTCVKRKTPSRPEGATAPLPEVVVSVGEEGKAERLTAQTKLKTYPVAVTIVTAGGQKAADDPTVRDWRQQIEQALFARATWSGIDGWSVVNITDKAPFDTAALSKDFNYSTIVAEVEVVEDLP